jgi:hypothetical protein
MKRRFRQATGQVPSVSEQFGGFGAMIWSSQAFDENTFQQQIPTANLVDQDNLAQFPQGSPGKWEEIHREKQRAGGLHVSEH